MDAKGKIEGQRTKDDDPVRPFTCSPGEVGHVENFDNDWSWRYSGRFTGINGKVEPELGGAKAGGFERWRLVNAGRGEPMRMRLYRLDPAAPHLSAVKGSDQQKWRERYCRGEPLPMWEIALDGLTRSAARKTDVATLFPGERKDVLVSLPERGRYCIVNDTGPDYVADANPTNPPRMVATVEAETGRSSNEDPGKLLQTALIRSADKALAGDANASIRERVVKDLADGVKLAAFVWHKPVQDAEVGGYREALLDITGGPEAQAFRVNGRSYDEKRIDAVLPLGKAEEWRAVAVIDDHPLHIHVNPFQIVSIEDAQGKDRTDPKSPAFDPDYAGLKGEWKDTIFIKENDRVIFRTRYERFTGDFLLHCHIMRRAGNDGAAGGQRGRDLLRQQVDGEIPRAECRRRPDRLPDDPAQLAGGADQGAAIVALDLFRVPIEQLRRTQHLGLGLGDDLALLLRQDGADTVDPLA